MSVTFCPIGAKYTLVKKPCDMTGCCPEDRCGYCDADGMFEDYERDSPELNVANVTAADLLRLLGLYTPDNYYAGEVEAEMIGTIRQRVMVALNSERRRAPMVFEGYVEQGESRARAASVPVLDGTGRIASMAPVTYIESGPRTIYGGRTDEQVIDRLERLDAVLVCAQQRGVGMRWS